MPRPRDLNEKYEVGKSGRKEMNKDYGSIASLINNEVSRHYKRNLKKVSLIKSCGGTLISLINVEVGVNVEGVQKLQNQ